jgi:hypothetical protein
LESVVKQLHAEIGKSDSVTAGNFTRCLVAARFVASLLSDAFGATPYFSAFTLVFRLHQSTFIVLTYRARKLPCSRWWRSCLKFTVICGAAGLLSACASGKLASMPPAGVDFSGTWQLNQADSDDPQRLLQNQTDPSRAKTSGGPTGGGPSGGGGPPGGGRGCRRGGRAGGGTGEGGTQAAPSSATLRVLGSSLHWPGRDLQIKQVAGTVELTSENISRTYRPTDAKRHKPASTRDEGARRRGGPPPLCGWSAKTLIVVGDSEDDRLPVEQHYGLSEDGQRLVEIIGIKGHMDKFTMSRVWDRTR